MNKQSITQEKDLYHIWENFCRTQSRTDDHRLCGIFAGQLNRFEGPDYQSAEFEIDGKIYRGDVEIHCNINDWYSHRHHLDPRYDGVLLHLVWDIKTGAVTYTSKRRKIFTINLRQFPELLIDSDPRTNCVEPDFSHYLFEERLKMLAIKRMRYKIPTIKGMVNSLSYDQTLFTLLMRILGYPHNVKNFEYLAAIIPWENLMALKHRYHFSSDQWTMLLLFKSGLIKRKPDSKNLKEILYCLEAINNADCLPAHIWQLSGQRPHNNPISHLHKLAYWIHQFPDQSLYHSLKDIITKRLSCNLLLRTMIKFLSPNSKKQLPDLQNSQKEHYQCTWGKSQIIEIIGNMIIPFFYREAEESSSQGFRDYLDELFFFLPQGSTYAKLDLFNHWPKIKNREFRRFYVNQAFLYLKERFCSINDCKICPLTGGYKDIDKRF